MQAAGVRRIELHDRKIRMGAVDRNAPLNAAEAAAATRAIAPDLRALAIGVEPVRDARFLTSDDQIASVRKSRQGRRGANVEIGSRPVTAVDFTRDTAEDITRRQLMRPPDAAGLQI